MDRRHFVKTLGTAAAVLSMRKMTIPFSDSPQIAITIDDFNLFRAAPSIAEKRNRALLAALRAHSNLKAAAFIAARNVDSETGKSLVREWGTAGHLIANLNGDNRSYRCEQFIGQIGSLGQGGH